MIALLILMALNVKGSGDPHFVHDVLFSQGLVQLLDRFVGRLLALELAKASTDASSLI